MENNKENRRFSIRKYTVGVVSILTSITIFVGGQQAEAAETSQQHVDTSPQSQQTSQVTHKEVANNLSLDGESKISSTSTQTQDISEHPQDIANHHHKEVDTSRQGELQNKSHPINKTSFRLKQQKKEVQRQIKRQLSNKVEYLTTVSHDCINLGIQKSTYHQMRIHILRQRNKVIM
ncbi:YSIRK-type signal peptide-containing protein [Staphylococcus saccharolyticus]|uniref:YSIRK-type signal peptide-containing protein n=1 Tax=Staphylococcus saccharolyticus TaxID=33028 RepID=UPI0023689706|nr:YSIRK-type signal peptide-containing protein [Staphylococcus saccharolyticus]